MNKSVRKRKKEKSSLHAFVACLGCNFHLDHAEHFPLSRIGRNILQHCANWSVLKDFMPDFLPGRSTWPDNLLMHVACMECSKIKLTEKCILTDEISGQRKHLAWTDSLKQKSRIMHTHAHSEKQQPGSSRHILPKFQKHCRNRKLRHILPSRFLQLYSDREWVRIFGSTSLASSNKSARPAHWERTGLNGHK